MKKKLILLALAVIAILIAAFFLLTREKALLPFDQVTGPKPVMAEPTSNLLPTLKVAKAIGWSGNAAPKPAAGLAVGLFADGLDHPRGLYVLPNGDVLVAESNSPPRDAKNGGGGITGHVMNFMMHVAGADAPSPDRVMLLRDTNGDGRADMKTVLLAGLHSPSGMALVGDTLYIGDTDAVVSVPFKPGMTKITDTPKLVVKLPGGRNHWARNIVASPDGKYIYVGVGSATNIADDGLDIEQKRAAIWEINLKDGSDRIYAYGLRNPYGLAYEPETGELWTTVNERDMIGSDLVPDYLTQVQFGGFYGWPWYYWGGYIDKRVPEPTDDLQSYVIRPDYALGPHVAALGLSFAKGAALGKNFASGAFIAEHGSWNRRPLSGYKLVYVPFAKGHPAGKPVDVLTGFLSADDRAQGRPVSVAIDSKGALLVTDDVGNRVWRVTAK